VFEPHHSPLHANAEPLVYAVDSHYMWLYWFPRECPRACWEANDATTDEDVERWLERMRRVKLYAYRLPSETFEPWDKFFVSRQTVVALELVELRDLLARHAQAGVELRIAPSLYPLWEKVLASTLDFSGIRLRNAVRA